MGARKITCYREYTPGQPILCPIGEGTGLDYAGIDVGTEPTEPLAEGRPVLLTIVTPDKSLIAIMSLEEVACLQDALDAAVARVAGFVQAGGEA